MNKLSFIIMILLGSMTFAFAQETKKSDATQEDYEKLIENSLDVQFRNYAIETMGLNAEDTEAFDPIYRDYMRDKGKLIEKKYKMIDEYKEEMAEDDRRKDELNETGEFIEDFWQIDIDMAQMRNNYYDKLENKIGPFKAMEFFLIEQSAENRMQTIRLVEVMPMLSYFDYSNARNAKSNSKAWSSYDKEYKTYRNWTMKNDGNMSLSHDYTHNGIDQLAKTIYALSQANGINAEQMKSQKQSAMKMADRLQHNPKSTDHADIARKTFLNLATMLEKVQQSNGTSSTKDSVMKVKEAAKAIDADQLLTKQGSEVSNFFSAAEKALSQFSETSEWRTQYNSRNSGSNNK